MYSLHLKILYRYVFVMLCRTSHQLSRCVSAPWTAPAQLSVLTARHLEPNPKQYNILSFKQAPESYWENVFVCVYVCRRGVGGCGGSTGGHYLQEMRARVNRSGRSHRDAAFFWMKLLHPLPILSRISNAGTSLVEPPSRWRQTGSLVAESERKSIHSASDKRSEETKEEEMQTMPTEP